MATPDYTAEVWKTIPFAADYAVSDLGRIRRQTPNYRGQSGHIIAPAASRGYLAFTIYGCAPRRSVKVHVAVLEAFVGPRPSTAHQAAHGDGNRLNCRLDNLRWATRLENAADKEAHGTTVEGDRNPRALLSVSDVLAIRKRSAAGERRADLGREYGVTLQAISRIALRKSWRHI